MGEARGRNTGKSRRQWGKCRDSHSVTKVEIVVRKGEELGVGQQGRGGHRFGDGGEGRTWSRNVPCGTHRQSALSHGPHEWSGLG